MTTDNTADIIVVGDGLAALALLCSLRRSSLRILVLSHGLKRQPDNRGLALSLSQKESLITGAYGKIWPTVANL